MTSFSSGAPDGGERIITITHPSNGDQLTLSRPLTVAGNVTIAPFENSLAYSIFDSSNNQAATGSLTVQISQPGGPGSFSLPVDLSKITSPGAVRIQIEDILNTGINRAFVQRDSARDKSPPQRMKVAPGATHCASPKASPWRHGDNFHVLSRWLQPRESSGRKPQFVTVPGIQARRTVRSLRSAR